MVCLVLHIKFNSSCTVGGRNYLCFTQEETRLRDAGCSPVSESIEMAGPAAPRAHRSLASLAGSPHLVEGVCQLCLCHLHGADVCDPMAGCPKTTEHFPSV